MYDFCPLCLEKGLKRKTKAYQVTLDEAVWSCEERGCVWPFGFEEPIYLQRVAGKTWSCYWDDSKPNTSNRNDEVTMSIELPMFNSSDSESKDHDLQESAINNAQFIDNGVDNIKAEDKCEAVTQSCMNNLQETNNHCKDTLTPKLHTGSESFSVRTARGSVSTPIKCYQKAGSINGNVKNIMSSIKQAKKISKKCGNGTCESTRPVASCKSTVSSTYGQKILNNAGHTIKSKQCIPEQKKVRSNGHNQKYESIKQGVPSQSNQGSLCESIKQGDPSQSNQGSLCESMKLGVPSQSNQGSLCERKICNINDPIIHDKHCTRQTKKTCSRNHNQERESKKEDVQCQNGISPHLDPIKEPVTKNENSIKQVKKIVLNNHIQNHDSNQQDIPCETITLDAPSSTADIKVSNIGSSSDSDTSNSKLLRCDTEKQVDKECTNASENVSQGKISKETSLEVKNTEKMNQKILSNVSNLLQPHQDNNTNLDKKNNLNSITVSNLVVPQTQILENYKIGSGNQLQSEIVQNCQKSTDTVVTNSKLEQNTITTVKLDGLPPITLSYDASILNSVVVPKTDSSNSVKLEGTNVSAQPRLRSTQLSKRYSAECKKYKKFSFNAIMNKMKGQKANTVESVDNVKVSDLNTSPVPNVDANVAIKSKPEEKSVAISAERSSKEQTKSIVSLDISSIPNTSTTSCDNSVLSANISIDSFLDDFLQNDCSIPEEISDDWLNALLV